MEQATQTTNEITIYRNGELDRIHETKKITKRIAKKALCATSKTCSVIIDGLDLWCDAFQKEFDPR